MVQLTRATREVEGWRSARRCVEPHARASARAWALLQGRSYVMPEDIERLFLPVLGHRLLLTTSYLAETRALAATRHSSRSASAAWSSRRRRPQPGSVSSTAAARRTFPLLPRRRLSGLPLGEVPSRRRGHGSDVIGHRLYQPGDPVTTIDWFASARLASASGSDAFVVREHGPTRRRGWPSSSTAERRWPLIRRRCPGCTRTLALREAVAAVSASAPQPHGPTSAPDFGDAAAACRPDADTAAG